MKKIEAYECTYCGSIFRTHVDQHEEACKWKKEGHAVWYEDGKVCHAPKIPEGIFGPHKYPRLGSGSCEYGCGCWMGSSSSDGPVDPFGPCPKNLRIIKVKEEKKEAGIRYRKWSANPDGVPEDKTKCIVAVGLTSTQCSRKRGHGPNGEYCRQHAKIVENKIV